MSDGVASPAPRPWVADRYEILETLGRGAFGRTFLARDSRDDRRVAIKMLEPRGADWKAHELFEREAAVLRSLRHHGVPEVHDALRAKWDGADASFPVMEYVEGTSLAKIIDEHRQRRRDTDQVLPVIANRWQPGDQVRTLYLPHGDHDSVIVST